MPFVNDRISETRVQQELKRLLAADERDHELAGELVTATGPTADLASMRKRLLSHIVGQDHAIDTVLRSIAVAKSGLNDPDWPLANIFLLGPTGVGKTELVRQVAGMLRSAPDDLSRIDMSSLSQEHYMASLTGAPPGYAGAKENLSPLDRSKIAGNPYDPGMALFGKGASFSPSRAAARHGQRDAHTGERTGNDQLPQHVCVHDIEPRIR